MTLIQTKARIQSHLFVHWNRINLSETEGGRFFYFN